MFVISIKQSFNMRTTWTLIITILLLTSCATTNSVVKAKDKGKGTTKVYDISFEQAWDVAKRSFRWAGADAVDEYKSEGYMLTSKGMNLVTSGSVMGAWVEQNGSKSTVTVISKRRISTQLATGMTEGKFHKYFEAGVNILKSGQPLPAAAPEL